ncbi:MAG: thioredoxin domain-containing protein [Pseudomonadota bacterium]|nr:thioredoxin domain-containing protein [Pseudomonadota bacterium]MEC8712300.1 thioredoxin domain-containing protein [Pseudomonadota bacterium]
MKQATSKFPFMPRRRFIATSVGAATLLAMAPSALANDDLLKHALSPRVIGSDDAPIRVAEYYSMTCGHCADFHNNTFPKVKAKLIDEGIVRFEMRPFPLDGLALRAHALVRAVPETKFFPLVKMLLAKQPVWVRAADPVAELQKMARLAGVSADEFNGIMRNRPLLEGIVELRQQGMDDWKISSTPSFVVNDDLMISGNKDYEELAEQLSAFGA